MSLAKDGVRTTEQRLGEPVVLGALGGSQTPEIAWKEDGVPLEAIGRAFGAERNDARQSILAWAFSLDAGAPSDASVLALLGAAIADEAKLRGLKSGIKVPKESVPGLWSGLIEAHPDVVVALRALQDVRAKETPEDIFAFPNRPERPETRAREIARLHGLSHRGDSFRLAPFMSAADAVEEVRIRKGCRPGHGTNEHTLVADLDRACAESPALLDAIQAEVARVTRLADLAEREKRAAARALRASANDAPSSVHVDPSIRVSRAKARLSSAQRARETTRIIPRSALPTVITREKGAPRGLVLVGVIAAVALAGLGAWWVLGRPNEAPLPPRGVQPIEPTSDVKAEAPLPVATHAPESPPTSTAAVIETATSAPSPSASIEAAQSSRPHMTHAPPSPPPAVSAQASTPSAAPQSEFGTGWTLHDKDLKQ